MSAKYTRKGPLGNSYLERAWKTWFIVLDGEEFEFKRKRDAFRYGAHLLRCGYQVRIVEEEIIRTFSSGKIQDQKIRNDITNIISLTI